MSIPASSTVSRRNLLAVAASAPLTAGVNAAARGHEATTPRHVVIVGDSRLDRALGWAEIVAELAGDRSRRCTLLAAGPSDGDTIGDPGIVPRLLRRIPDDTSHLVLATGREELRRLERGPSDVMDTFTRLASIAQQFAASYSSTLEAALALGIPLTVCTLMSERSADPFRRRIADVALAIANDAITREASRYDLPVLDLRLAGRSTAPREIAGSLIKVLSR